MSAPSPVLTATLLGLSTGSSLLLTAVAPAFLRKLRLVRRNFRGEQVLTAAGTIIVAASVPCLLVLYSISHKDRLALALSMTVLGFGALGFQDDLFGTPQAKGLRGHIRALFLERRVTSGLIKAVGGLAVALAVSCKVAGSDWPRITGLTLTVALGANAGNLLDLRPGRAGAVAIAGMLVATIGFLTNDERMNGVAVVLILVPAAVVQYYDSRGRLMLGDTGSNTLGACASLSLCQAFPSSPFLLTVLSVLVALHVVAERYSLTVLIERSRILRWLDRLTGVR